METFPPHKRGAAMALYGMGVVLAPIVGPVLGGWITDNFSWHWIDHEARQGPGQLHLGGQRVPGEQEAFLGVGAGIVECHASTPGQVVGGVRVQAQGFKPLPASDDGRSRGPWKRFCRVKRETSSGRAAFSINSMGGL